MEKSPLVSILIVNYNTKKLLLDCINSIKKFVKCEYEIIVVDNASTDGSVEALPKSVTVIKNKNNVGFAAANNQAAQKAKGEYLLLLNSDTYLTKDSISTTAEILTNDPTLGVVSCTLLNRDGTLQPTGGFFPTPLRLFNWMTFIDDIPVLKNIVWPFHPSVSFYKRTCELDWVTGAFFTTPRSLYITLNGLDEDYFMYTEEMDYCYRVKQLRKKVLYYHDTSIVHLGRASGTNEFAIISELKHLVLFYAKHLPLWKSYAYLVIKIGCLLRMALYAILGRSVERKIYEKAFRTI